MKEEKNTFKILSSLNCNDKTEQKGELTYLSWTWAWSKVMEIYPDATYEIEKFNNNLPYVYDENTGYMVFTKITIKNETKEMWLPVMDGNNKSMLSHECIYKVKKYNDGKFTGEYIDKKVERATMFDINKTLMRCLVKNLAMFGLGIYIYSGEDYPEGYEISQEEAEQKIVNFGKYKGKNLKQIKEENENYLNWLLESDTSSESLKNAISKLIQPITDDSVSLTSEFNSLLIESESDLEKICEKFNVPNANKLSDEQKKDAIKVFKVKISRKKKE